MNLPRGWQSHNFVAQLAGAAVKFSWTCAGNRKTFAPRIALLYRSAQRACGRPLSMTTGVALMDMTWVGTYVKRGSSTPSKPLLAHEAPWPVGAGS